MSSRTTFARTATFAALALAATTVSVDAASVARASTSTEPPSGASTDTIEGLFAVGGGRNLYLKCEGTGSPTIVYFHGAGGAPAGSSATAGEVPRLLRDDYRFCIYDRANTGRSDPAPGPLTPADAVEDLHTLLDVADVPGPYVLLGASRGGVVAFVYAGTHPEDIAGAVFLDPDVPGIGAWELEFVPEQDRPPEDALRDLWRDDPEQWDYVGYLEELDAAADSIPAVPAILFALAEYEFPPEFGEGAEDALRDLQQNAMDHFDPGEVRIVDAPHDMHGVIDEEIAAAVREVIGATTSTDGSAPTVTTTST